MTFNPQPKVFRVKKASKPLKRTMIKRRPPRRLKRSADPVRLDRLHHLDCVLANDWGRECCGHTTVHHLIGVKYHGTAYRAPDRFTIPLCQAHHQDSPVAIQGLGSMGQHPWEEKFGTQEYWLEVTDHLLRLLYPDDKPLG